MVPAMIYLLRMPTNIVIGTSIFQIIFVTAVVTVLHATLHPHARCRARADPRGRRRHRRPVRRESRAEAEGRAAAGLACGDGARRRPSAVVRSRAEAVRAVQHRSAHGGGMDESRAQPRRSAARRCAGRRLRPQKRRRRRARPREEVQSDISTREISIQSNFTGIEILIYGSVDFSQTRRPTQGVYDVIIVIRAPVAAARRQAQGAGGRHLGQQAGQGLSRRCRASMPRCRPAPFRAITSDETLKMLGIGLANVDFGRATQGRRRRGDAIARP